jgi:8-oxo-dGTP pyrophosphatase MutT (NUDIX family)
MGHARPNRASVFKEPSRAAGPMALRRKVMVFLYRRTPGLEVLLLKRTKAGKGDWHPVTGNVEAHETIPHAAIREVEEETGIGIVPEPLGVTHTYEERGSRYHETAFASSTMKDAKVELSEEHTEFAWLAPGEAMQRLAWDTQKKALEQLVKMRS